MKKETMYRTTRLIKNCARTVLLVLSTLLFIFSLLSGADRLGGGIKGIIHNFPNTLPWIILLVAVFVSFKWELIGGIIILLMGIFSIFFFNAFENIFVLLVISIPLIVLSKLLIITWYFDRPKD